MESVWGRLASSQRRFALLAVVLGSASVLVGIAWASAAILAGAPAGDLILFPPSVVSVVVYAALIGTAALVVARSAGADPEMQSLARLGAMWALASIPLMFDFLIDSFPGKVLINLLFVVAGVRYWKGLRNSYLSLLLAPLTALIAMADGFGHLLGNFCSAGSALDACPAKAVSDFYLVMLMIGLTAVTLMARSQRPDFVKLALYVLAIVAVLAVFALAPF